MHATRIAVLLVTVGFLVGCDGGPKEPTPVTVTGTVLVDDKPLANGTISFSANDGRPPGEGTITNGAYSLQVPPGERRVEIHHYAELKEKGPGGETLTKDTIPAKYNNESTLKAQVTAAGPNEFTFKLDGK